MLKDKAVLRRCLWPTSGQYRCRKMQFGSFSFSVLSSCVSSSRACVKATTAQLHLCCCSLGSPCVRRSKMGCVLCGSSSQTCRLFPLLLQALEASADRLPCTASRGSVAGCFSALANMFRQTAFGPCRHLLVRLLWSCRAEFLGQKGLVKSDVRQCEEQSVVGLFAFRSLTSSRHDGASAVCEA